MSSNLKFCEKQDLAARVVQHVIALYQLLDSSPEVRGLAATEVMEKSAGDGHLGIKYLEGLKDLLDDVIESVDLKI